MRPLVFAAAADRLVPVRRRPRTRIPSQAACDAAKIGARELAECLRTTADQADRELATAVEAAIKSIDARPGLLSSQKARWRRSLNDAQAQWVAWRDSECQDVAPFESGMDAKARRSAPALHHRLRRRARLEPQGALSLSDGPAALELGFRPRQSRLRPLKEVSFG